MMGTALQDGLTYLTAQPAGTLLLTFWFVLLFEVPHYSFRFVAAGFSYLSSRLTQKPDLEPKPISVGRITVIIAGHNEACAIERCVASLHEQSLRADEIIVVSDGSTDMMPRKLRALADAGLIDFYYSADVRGGKAAGLNLAADRAMGDIIVNIDCDCSLDRYPIEELVRPFDDPRVGAVCGNILVRNVDATLLTKFQAIEYLITISLGKVAAGLVGQVVCISGAFGAFRRAAYEAIHGSDPGGGEDLDLTLRLRKAGWRMAFAPDSIVATDVPETFKALLRQRFRWDRDALGLRYRKHRELMNPFSRRFRPTELFHEIEFILFTILPAAAFPFYILWLFDLYGAFAFAILLSAQAGLFLLDIASFLLAALANPKAKSLGLMLYLPGYSFYGGYVMRFVRLFAFVQEWIFSASRKDPYVPEKVLRMRSW